MSENETTLRENALTVREAADAVVITDKHAYEEAGFLRREIKAAVNKITDYWKPLKDAAYAQHKALVAREAEMLTPLKEADKTVEARMLEYYREQERIRKEAEAERARLEAEARRLEAEAAAKAAEAQRLIDEASQKDELDEDDVEILRMAQAEADRADAIADSAPVQVYIPSAPKAYGMAVKHVWRARIVDPSQVPVEIAGMVIRPIDEKMLNKLAVTSQGKFLCPGVEWYQEEQTAVRL